jgi:hypothetical protein
LSSLSFGSQRTRPRKATLAVALVAATTLLPSCATIREDPVLCGVLGSVAAGVAGGALGAALATSEQAFPAIAGATIGAALGGWGGYQICKYPNIEDTADAKARKARSTSPGTGPGAMGSPDDTAEPAEPEAAEPTE